ncbi:MAG: sigma 54-interacting transcriptional regulator [Nitrospirae bacterium]|nr:sigma 54-interacting transcriptional regulator [Nitrospirota bacterium]
MQEERLLKRKNAELSALLEVSKALNSSFELEKNLTHSMRVLSDYLEMSRGTVTLLDPVTKELRIVAAYGLAKEQITRGKYKIGEGIVGRAVKTGFPMVIPNIGDEPLFLNRTRSRIDKDKISFLCVPIKLKGDVLGVLSVDRIFGDKISFEEDLRVLKIVAALIAQSVGLYQSFSEERQEKENLTLELKGRYSLPNIIGLSDKMQEVFKTVLKVSKSKATVLLRGESGTGKELIARAIHYQSPRSNGPFIAINCAALPENLLEAELFGFEKGAFTGAIACKKGKFELAERGTIFLDEIGDVSFSIQGKLLRVLQEHSFDRLGGTRTIHVDVRIIAATNRDVEKMLHEGSFREDLYWRLNVVPVFLPALRERKEDLNILIEYFLQRFNKEYKKNVSLSKDALKRLLGYSYPGNVREMENTIERLIVLSDGDRITEDALPLYLRMQEAEVKLAGTMIKNIEEIERKNISNALKECGFIQAKAARMLGITPRQMGYKVKKYKIDVL